LEWPSELTLAARIGAAMVFCYPSTDRDNQRQPLVLSRATQQFVMTCSHREWRSRKRNPAKGSGVLVAIRGFEATTDSLSLTTTKWSERA
jgi:hypothetical protein